MKENVPAVEVFGNPPAMFVPTDLCFECTLITVKDV